jgi:hypothetical protein
MRSAIYSVRNARVKSIFLIKGFISYPPSYENSKITIP